MEYRVQVYVPGRVVRNYWTEKVERARELAEQYTAAGGVVTVFLGGKVVKV